MCRHQLEMRGRALPTSPHWPNPYCRRAHHVQVPAYLAKQSELKAKGISEVVVYCVNDMAVMEAWAKAQVRPRLDVHRPTAARPTPHPLTPRQ
jgi:phage terminase small subunit